MSDQARIVKNNDGPLAWHSRGHDLADLTEEDLEDNFGRKNAHDLDASIPTPSELRHNPGHRGGHH